MMAYGALSPVFNALEAVGNALTGGDFAAGGREALFCQRCHNPVSVDLGEFPDFAAMEGRPSRDFAGEIGRHGLSCDVCHQVAHADLAGSLLGDGIANAAFVMRPGSVKFGPVADPVPNSVHRSSYSSYLKSADFCGSCHDVRLRVPDAVTGEPFQRLENLFTEWRAGPYAGSDNPYGRPVTCQDCHMSLYPYAPPGTYPRARAAALADVPEREVSTHYFTGVDVALVDFPGQDEEGTDEDGTPPAQVRRREDLLRAACDLALHVPPAIAAGEVLPVEVAVTNVGAGHNVPAGFSQERQVWLEVVVKDADGGDIYRSGFLTDRPHPETGETVADGSLHDEDLEDVVARLDPHTGEAEIRPGPDHDRRPYEQSGLVNFGNRFVRRGPEGGFEEVFLPFLAEHMDNGHSIPPLETVRVRYDVPVPGDAAGRISVRVRLRFRPFPPRFVRFLAETRPDLVDETIVDRNRIVDMAEVSGAVQVLPR